MADYKTHLTYSTVGGVALGGMAYYIAEIPIALCIFSGALCSVGGLVPDIDSKTSQSFQRILSIIAGFMALMLVSRLREFTLSPESVVIVGGTVFLVTWGVLGTLIQKCTRHRGMCHSIPMAIIAGEVIYILASGETPERLFKGFAMFLGVMIHLVLDEFYSIQINVPAKKKSTDKVATPDSATPGKDATPTKTGSGKIHIKKSLGTAIKMIDFDNTRATVICFIFLAILTDIAINQPVWSDALENDSAQTVPLGSKKMMNTIKTLYPSQFDVAVIEWIAENKLLLEPNSPDNPKWQELQLLFDSNDATATSPPPLLPSSVTMANSAVRSEPTPSTPAPRKLSFIEQINWSNRRKNSSDPELPPP